MLAVEKPFAAYNLCDGRTDEASEKVDVLIKLQAATLIASIDPAKDKIVFLNKAGLRPKLVAKIVGTTPNHVNVPLSNDRKLKAASRKSR